jgi:PAT family beta-lactamase induction signal transducer AmpG
MALRTKLLWVAALYFASGLPFGIVNYLLPVFLRNEGTDLSTIGRVISDVGLAWTLKFLWAPMVDRFGRRRSWIILCQLGIAALTLWLIAADPIGARLVLWAILALLAALSATQDIAIDAYTIQLLDVRELGVANGIRVGAYRIAIIVTSGALVALAGSLGWSAVFMVAAAIMGALALLVLGAPRRDRAPQHQSLLEPARALLDLPYLWAVVLFVLTFKLGDLAMQPMVAPFWVDRGLSEGQIGLIGTLSIGAAIGGALVGGVLTTRWGVFRALWILGLVQALSNLGYFLAARADTPRSAIYAAAMVEQVTWGLGTSAFLAFLMSVCEKRYAGTQFAVLTALYGLSRWMGGRYSGDLAEALGYAGYFLLTFAFALPAFALIPFIRRVPRRGDARVEAV